MLKKYFYLLITCLLVVLFTACSEDDSSTGSGSGSGGGSTQECSLSSEDLQGTWKLQSASSSATLTTIANISVLDAWSEVTTPMNVSIIMGDADPVTASLNYLHVSSNDEKIFFFLSEESFWSSWGNTYIEIECDITDLNSCSSFMSHMDGTNSVHVDLSSISSVEWVETPSNGTYELTIPIFSEVAESSTISTDVESAMSTGSIIINADTPLVIQSLTDVQDAWDQSYMTLNSDGTISHYNTLDCDLINPENDNDCYSEGCAPTMTDDMLTGCSNVDCGSLANINDCLSWNACVWLDNTCLDYESNDMLASGWSLNCNNGESELVLTTTNSGTDNSYNVAYDVLVSDNQMSMSISQDFCNVYYYYGYDCDAYSGPAADFYGLSGNQIESLVISSAHHYIVGEMPTMRSNDLKFIENPIARPNIIHIFGK